MIEQIQWLNQVIRLKIKNIVYRFFEHYCYMQRSNEQFNNFQD